MSEPLVIQAVVSGARTTKDGGWTLSFETGEHMATQVTEAMKLRDKVIYLVLMTEEQYEGTR